MASFLGAALTTFLGALLGAAFLAAVALARGIIDLFFYYDKEINYND